ncbi:MAG: chromosomal replication initiator protein DnaA [Candidatus Poribacteria bacterium]|nr:chromosomal replication initiator protein DnaA [Candidatus Poribacteria bacterium]
MSCSNGVSADLAPKSSETQPPKSPIFVPTSTPRVPANSGLNPALTFDRFVVGQSNRKAHETAMDVINLAQEVNNPLIIHGGVGLGKTHLLHAIGNQFSQRRLDRTVYCLSAERFIRNWIQSVANPQKSAALRRQYQYVDLLLIDDIHFLSQEARIQGEFFHLLNTLIEQGQGLVCTCDRLPQFLEDFWNTSDVLKQGEIVEIHPPEFDLRVSILKQKLREQDWEAVPLKVLHYLAKHLTKHIRQLEGALNRLGAEARLGSPLTLHVARHVIEGRSPGPPPSGTIALEDIQEVVARYFHLTVSELCSRKRGRRFVLPRQVAMYLARQLTPLSLTRIGQGFGRGHRTTVARSCQRIETLLKEDLVLNQSIEALTTELTHLNT